MGQPRRKYSRNQYPFQKKTKTFWSGFCGVDRPRRVGGTDSNVFTITFFSKTKTPDIAVGGFVVWAGIEPATQGFSVLCSTD